MGSKELEELISQKRIALDTSLFILALENNSDFPLATELFRLIPKSKATVYASVLVITEVLNKSYELKHVNRIPDQMDFLTGKGLIDLVEIDKAIALRAAELRAKYSLKTPDAIHLATAVERNCEYFLTTDNDFGTSTNELNIIFIPGIKK